MKLAIIYQMLDINYGILNTKWPGRLEKGKLGNINYLY